MKPEKICKRITLAGSQGCRILYCEECNVAEMEIGSLSLRLDVEAFNTLAGMAQEGLAKLALLNEAKTRARMTAGIHNVH